MNIHEYQAKEMLRGQGVPVPDGAVAESVEQVLRAANMLRGPWVLKAQVHAGGRGKAGGVRLCHTREELTDAARALLGSRLVTPQTGAAGKRVHLVYVEQASEIVEEYYLGMLIDREQAALAFVVSPDGGMDIETVARTTPEAILTLSVQDRPTREESARMAAFLRLPETMFDAFHAVAEGLYDMFLQHDLSLLELNPLVRTRQDQLLALDAKVVVDDNALFRQPELAALRDPREEDPRETEARRFGLNYIALDGDIGCMVNGAGLAMATMDIIQLKGGRPANFLDVGGGVTVEAVSEGFRLLFADAHVRAVLVNIFGGIVRCDIIAQGLLDALRTTPMRVPVIMRLGGTNEEEGRALVREAGLDVRWADDLDQAASMAVAAAGEDT
ncbi:MAG: ADP-forming succinate--CoA ligase subunit beta [Zetaproteobacteria bacterium]|nr:MAG: ADP-forming succinate--CoA ligase subunit beta [Zetaproteobacteria bacterium]